MDVNAVTTQTAQTAQAQKSLSGNYETFLRLLTTQLQNQDPLEPLDATKFTEQLVSYSQVEQQIATNSNLSSLIALNKSAAGANAVTYLGRTAITSGNASSLDGGAAAWRYTLPRDAATLQLNVTDASGRVIRSLTGSAGVGPHEITWDGLNTSGTQMPAGTYQLSVTARAADGANVPVTVSGLGLVKEIDMSGLEPQLTIGGRKVSLAAILGLKN